jgi:hypothetical protein
MAFGSITLADVLGPWQNPDYESGLIMCVRGAWTKPMQQLTNQELATCLAQRIGIEHLLPIAKKRVADHFDDDTELQDTELAEAIADAEYWCQVDDEDRRIRGLPPRVKQT